MKLSDIGNGMLFPPSWYDSPPDVPEPDEVDLWPWEDERDLLAERGAYDRDDECRVCGVVMCDLTHTLGLWAGGQGLESTSC